MKAGSAGLTLGAASGSVTFGDGATTQQTITGDVKTATGHNRTLVTDQGKIIIANTHANGVTFKGDLGGDGTNEALNTLTLNANTKATLEKSGYFENGVIFNDGSQMTLNGTSLQTVGGNLTSADGGNYGRIIIGSDINDADVTFTGALGLGASGTNNALDSLTLKGASDATFKGNVYLANGLTLGNGTVTFGGSGTQDC